MAPRILFCNCTFAQVVPKETKQAVLRQLCQSGAAFEAVADLCEMSARGDPALARLAQEGSIKIAACFPRAVKWLFAAGGAPLPLETTEVLNMRLEKPDAIVPALFHPELHPNLPADKPAPPGAEHPSDRNGSVAS